MIAELSAKPKSFQGMILYNEKKIAQNKAELIANFTAGTDQKSIIEDLQRQSLLNERIKKNPSKEIIISLSKKDRQFSNAEFVHLAQDYMKNMGYTDVPYVIYRHYDQAHPHIHIIASRVRNDGSLVNEFYEQFRGLTVSRELEKKYSLEINQSRKKDQKLSLNEINAQKYSIQKALKKEIPETVSRLLGSEILEKIKRLPAFSNNNIKHEFEKQNRLQDYTQLVNYLESHQLIHRSHKEKLHDTLYFCKKTSRSSDEFFSKLNKNNVYFRILKKPEGEQITYGIKDIFYYKKVPRQFQLDQIRALDHPGKKITHTKIQQKRFLKATVAKTLKTSYSIEDFINKLEAKGVKVELYGKPGNWTGMAFTNETITNGIRFKASELHRDLSISNIQLHLEKNRKFMPPEMRKQLQSNDTRPLNTKKLARNMEDYDSEDQTDQLKYRRKL